MPERDGRNFKSEYKCKEYPCIHIVVDDRRKIFKVFIEDYDYIIPLKLSELTKVCEILARDNRLRRYREAKDDEEDYLARKYLGAEPLKEEE